MSLLLFLQLVTLIVLALSQSLANLPSCARNCLNSSIGDCSLLDARCICHNGGYVNDFSCCTIGGCTATEQHDSWEWAKKLCSTVNVALGDQIGCASAASSSSVRSTSASAASTASTRSETSTTTITIVTVSSPASSSTHSPTAEETRTTAALSSPATVTVTFVAEPPTEAAAPSGSGMKIGVGAGVGIGMGAAVGALLLLASIIVWCRRRRARGTNGNGSTTAAASSPLDFGYTEVGQGAHASELGHRDHYAAVEASEQDGFELSSLPSDYQEMPTAFNTPRPRSELVAEQSAPPVSPAPPRPARSSPVPGEEGENFFEA